MSLGQETPSTMKALVTQADKTAIVEEIPVPEIADDEVLIRTSAVALNPTDWKHIKGVTRPGTIAGVDFAGKIARIGKNVTGLAIGDNVASFVHGGVYKDRGAFAQYVKTAGELVWKIPDDSLTFEEAATMGCGLWTSVQALFHPGRLGLVEPPEKVFGEHWVFVYGGSSSVGLFAIDLAHLAGYKVVTVASPRNFDLVKSYGADAVFDYKDPDVVEKIKEVTKDTVHHAFDTISIESSQIISVKVLAAGPGKLVVVQSPATEAKFREDVPIIHTLIYTALGNEFHYGSTHHPANAEDRGHIAKFLKKLPEFVTRKLVKPNPIKFWEGGLASISDGLQFIQEGKNSGEKVVFKIE
ncbi:GroES-like protein [Abortiporus biennis]|nr:GroES-like protein [Abortiporus biennis]